MRLIKQLPNPDFTAKSDDSPHQLDDLALERGRRLAARLWPHLQIIPLIASQAKSETQARAWVESWGAALAANTDLFEGDIRHALARVARGDWDDSKPFSFPEFRRLAVERMSHQETRQAWEQACRARALGDWSQASRIAYNTAQAASRQAWGWAHTSMEEINGRWHKLANRVARGLEGPLLDPPPPPRGHIAERRDHSSGLAALRAWADQVASSR